MGKVRSGTKIVPFVLFDFQIDLIEFIEQNQTVVITKTRQLGVTEVLSVYFVWKAFLDPAYLAVVFSKGQEDTANVAKRCRLFVSTHPDLELATDNLQDLTIAGGGRILFKPSTDNAGRSLESVHDFLFDESAFVPNIAALSGAATGANEMVGDRAKVIYASTPNGTSGYHFDLLNQSNGDRDFLQETQLVRNGKGASYWVDLGGIAKAVLHWWVHPIYSARSNYLAEIKRKKRLTDATLNREYNLGYDDSDSVVYPRSLVESASIGSWAAAIAGRKYLAGVDPNSGGGDFFVAGIFDVTRPPYSLVAIYRDCRRSTEYSIIKSLELFDAYKPKIIAVESNAMGVWAAEAIAKARPRFRVEQVATTQTSKYINTDRLVLLLEAKKLIFPADSPLPEEFKNFRQTGKSRAASQGFHDDCVMMCSIAFSAIDLVKASGANSLIGAL